jgi:hypothetical protein
MLVLVVVWVGQKGRRKLNFNPKKNNYNLPRGRLTSVDELASSEFWLQTGRRVGKKLDVSQPFVKNIHVKHLSFSHDIEISHTGLQGIVLAWQEWFSFLYPISSWNHVQQWFRMLAAEDTVHQDLWLFWTHVHENPIHQTIWFLSQWHHNEYSIHLCSTFHVLQGHSYK